MRHCIQYAMVGGRMVYDTERLTDEQLTGGCVCEVDRFNRCPVCEEWTTYNGKLRGNVGYPAVVKALDAAKEVR